MSRWRLDKRLRGNADFQAMTRFLDDAKLKWEVVKPNTCGHPALEITAPDGTVITHHIASTPRGSSNSAAKVAALKRKLRDAGIKYQGD